MSGCPCRACAHGSVSHMPSVPQSVPHYFSDARGIYRTASLAPGSAHGAGAATEPPIFVRRPGQERGRTDQQGGTAVDTRSTSRTQSAESTRWVVAPNKKTASGHRRRHSPKNRQSRTGSTVPRPEHSGTLRKAKWGSGANAPGPPPARLPPGLSGTMGSTSPAAAAETAAVRRHPAGPARAATAQSTAVLAPAPAPARRSRSP